MSFRLTLLALVLAGLWATGCSGNTGPIGSIVSPQTPTRVATAESVSATAAPIAAPEPTPLAELPEIVRDNEPPTPEPAIDEQTRVIPVLPQRAPAFAARSLPPERLIIPTIQFDSRIIPLGTRLDRMGQLVWETAAFAVGHHRGSANPGESGNLVLSGHISSPAEGAVFRQLPLVKPGDGLIIATTQQHHLYRVRDVRVVAPNAVDAMDPTSTSTATLITCVPDGIYSHRLVVSADAI